MSGPSRDFTYFVLCMLFPCNILLVLFKSIATFSSFKACQHTTILIFSIELLQNTLFGYQIGYYSLIVTYLLCSTRVYE